MLQNEGVADLSLVSRGLSPPSGEDGCFIWGLGFWTLGRASSCNGSCDKPWFLCLSFSPLFPPSISLSLSLPSQCAIRGWGIFLVWVFIFLIYKPRSWTGWYPRNLEVLTLKIPGSLVHGSFFMCLPWFWLTNVLLSVWQEIWYLVFILSYLNSLESPDRGLVGL